ncbi:MAG: hypothetical protein ABR987_00320 [Terracidiphilus sp.]|jgi:hypothetical protein
MGLRLKLNSLAALALSLVFYFFFMAAKHDPALAPIIPFGDDPYDAVGSFCLILSILLAVLSLVRAFRPYRAPRPTAFDQAFLARTQIAIPLGILVALATDAIAMARHTSIWMGKAGTAKLAALMLAMAAISLATVYLVRRSARGIELPAAPMHSTKTVIAVLAFILILALFPEQLIQSVTLHFLAILLSFVLIAASQAALSVALLPFATDKPSVEPPASQPRSRRWVQWVSVAVAGLAIGTLILMSELFGEGAAKAPLAQVLLLSAIFIGAGTACLLIAFAFFKKPLGLFSRAT